MQEEKHKKSFFGPVITVLVIVTGLSGLIFWKMNSGKSGAGPQGFGPGGPSKPMPQKVTGYIVQSEALSQTIETNGSLLAWQEVQLIPEMAGRIEVLNLKEGSQVAEGQTLLVLFNEDIKAQIKKQELQLQIAKKNLARLQDLFKINGISQQEVDNAENQVNNIQSDLKIFQANLRKTQLIAPFSGQVGLTNASIGTYVNPGNPIASLQQVNPLKLEFSIPERFSGLIKIGQEVLFSVENESDTLSASIYAIEPKIDPASRTLKVRARFENGRKKLMPGLFSRVAVNLEKTYDNLMVPSQSIIPETRGKKVVKFHNGKAEMVVVETGIRNSDNVQIVNGLQKGDTILTSGLMFVKPQSELILTNLKSSK